MKKHTHAYLIFIMLLMILSISIRSNAQPVDKVDSSTTNQSISLSSKIILLIYNEILSITKQQHTRWQSELVHHFIKYPLYPKKARELKKQGIVKVFLVIDHKGNIISTAIHSSSGNSLLDQAALDTVHRASPVPAPPNSLLKNGTIKLILPFNYQLSRRSNLVNSQAN